MLFSELQSSLKSKPIFIFKPPLALPQRLSPCLRFATEKSSFFHIHTALPSDACAFQKNWGLGTKGSRQIFQAKPEKLKDECFIKVVSDGNRSLEQKILLSLSCGSNECLQDTHLCMSQNYCIQMMLCEERKGE